jgi:hypothetical protein
MSLLFVRECVRLCVALQYRGVCALLQGCYCTEKDANVQDFGSGVATELLRAPLYSEQVETAGLYSTTNKRRPQCSTVERKSGGHSAVLYSEQVEAAMQYCTANERRPQ